MDEGTPDPAQGRPEAEEPLFEIGADGIDTEEVVRRIRDRVAAKAREGAYADAEAARAERTALADLLSDEEFMPRYLASLREAVQVDINDFDIVERRERLAPLLVSIKRRIWSLLKFYTYRLWSQQNQVNGLLLAAIEGVENRYAQRLRELEARVRRLEPETPEDHAQS